MRVSELAAVLYGVVYPVDWQLSSVRRGVTGLQLAGSWRGGPHRILARAIRAGGLCLTRPTATCQRFDCSDARLDVLHTVDQMEVLVDPNAADDQTPLPAITAWRAVVRCIASSFGLLARRRVHHPREHVGSRLWFEDGTSARVYRETVLERPPADQPCVLVVAFRLRAVRGRGHALFRAESWLNIPLFVGFPGLVSKLWLGHDQAGRYRGFYEWDGVSSARAYARALWRVLAVVSAPGTIQYAIAPDVHRDEALAAVPAVPSQEGADPARWWRLAAFTTAIAHRTDSSS